MPNISVDYLDQLIEDSQKKGQVPERILIGYKAYSELMNNRRFSEEVTNSALSPDKRKYKKIKIKVTQDDYQLALKG